MSTYLVITAFFPTKDSFRGAFIYDQVCAIQKTKKYDRIVILKAKPFWDKSQDYEYGGFHVHYFPIMQMPSNLLLAIPDKLNKHLFMNTLKNLGVDVNDIVVAHAHVSLNACYLLPLKKANPKIKTVLQHHDADPFAINMSRKLANCGWNTYLNSYYLTKIYGKIDLHVCISHKVEYNLRAFPKAGQEEIYPRYFKLLEYAKGIKPAQIKDTYILYNGVNTEAFYKTDTEKDSKSFRIGCIGNFTEIKDQITLLHGIKRLVDKGIHNLEVDLIGSGEYLDACKDYVHQNNLESFVNFKQEVKHEDLLGFYNSLDLFVLPSYYEGFGCVFTEAYACGVPFITCYHQGVSEIVENPDQWLIDKGDDKKLATLIENYIKNRPLQVLNKDFEINNLISNYLKYVENI